MLSSARSVCSRAPLSAVARRTLSTAAPEAAAAPEAPASTPAADDGSPKVDVFARSERPERRYKPYNAPRPQREPFVPVSAGGTKLADQSQLPHLGAMGHIKSGQMYTLRDLDDTKPGPKAQAAPDLSQIKFDVFQAMRTNPLNVYKEHELMANFVSETGMIMHRKNTKLAAKNQRKLTKAVKRARAMGLMPYTYREPLKRDSPGTYAAQQGEDY
ncbi:ribosomal protein S18 [Blastocladiella britannica]|nr:ribosomal protein S18 [Blastocladiella britannica]